MTAGIRIAALLGLLAAASAGAQSPDAAAKPARDAAGVERGRYLVRITGCNDCHTAGFAERGGDVPESQWLTGSSLGFRGPWGTTYPSNLRLTFAKLSEDQWVKTGRTLKTRPPMPWFSVRAMTDADLRAMYRFVRTLKPLGEPAPAFLPPGQEPPGPVIVTPAPPQK
jgi:mono/diheme cytochrome c family protein